VVADEDVHVAAGGGYVGVEPGRDRAAAGFEGQILGRPRLVEAG
jgi:hypothetical protein